MEDPQRVTAQTNYRRSNLVASTADLHARLPASEIGVKTVSGTSLEPFRFFKSLQWSADGTTILASLSTQALTTFIAPPDLLDPPNSGGSHPLQAFSRHSLPEPSYANAIHPAHDLQDPSTCLAIASVRNLPLRLFSTIYNSASSDADYGDNDGEGDKEPRKEATSAVLASYPLVSPTTEAYLGAHSLQFGSDSNWLYAGTDGMVAAFDLNRSGEGPLEVMRTGGRRRKRKSQDSLSGLEKASGMRGIVSALAISADGMLAAGTFGRWVGLYDGFSPGGCVATFSLAGSEQKCYGGGVTEVRWSACSRYLVVAERASDGISIWDIRGAGKRLAWLVGRKAKTQQRMSVDVFGNDVWAGGTDGLVRVWEHLGQHEGDAEHAWDFSAHNDVVSGVGMHSSGSVLATCSGQRHFPGVGEEEEEEEEEERSAEEWDRVNADTEANVRCSGTPESTLKLWAT